MTIVGVLGWVVAAGAGGWAWALSVRLRDAEWARLALGERTRIALTEADAAMRRIREEAERTRPFAAEPVLRDLVELVDNLDRAIAAGEGGAGVSMIQRQSLDLLRRHGAERISSLEEPLDPTAHEAVATRPASGPPGRVLVELSAGYRLHGRLLRAARVVVAVALPPDALQGDPVSPTGPSPSAEPEPSVGQSGTRTPAL